MYKKHFGGGHYSDSPFSLQLNHPDSNTRVAEWVISATLVVRGHLPVTHLHFKDVVKKALLF